MLFASQLSYATSRKSFGNDVNGSSDGISSLLNFLVMVRSGDHWFLQFLLLSSKEAFTSLDFFARIKTVPLHLEGRSNPSFYARTRYGTHRIKTISMSPYLDRLRHGEPFHLPYFLVQIC